MSHADGSMVLESPSRQADQLVLQIGNLRDAGASEVSVLDGIIGKFRFGSVDNDLTKGSPP